MTDQSEWTGRVGHSWAAEWQRTDRSFGVLTASLLEIARGQKFGTALDIGCGAGELSLKLALSHPEAQVTGVDVSADLVAVAQDRVAAQHNVRIELGDAATWKPGDDRKFDLLISRHGVMFFAEPEEAFANLLGQSVPGARLVFSCFRPRQDNAWVTAVASALAGGGGAAPDPNAPGPFAFGDRGRVEDILGAAGWRDIAFERFDYPMIVGEGDDAAADALSYFMRIGPAASVIAMLEGQEREDTIERLRGVIRAHHTGDTVALPASAWIVTAIAEG